MNKPEFQRALGVEVDGIVGDKTVAAFEQAITNRSAPAISRFDLEAAADLLATDVAHIEMIRATESGVYGSFDSEGRPTILFERHKFRSFTGAQFDVRFPDISNAKPGGYSSSGLPHHIWQWAKLRRALRLDPAAAIKSCSWGLFQVMGFNWRALGYEGVFDMAVRMAKSEGAQLDAAVRFLLANDAQDELRACHPGEPRTCRALAEIYNGPGNVDVYASTLAANLERAARQIQS